MADDHREFSFDPNQSNSIENDVQIRLRNEDSCLIFVSYKIRLRFSDRAECGRGVVTDPVTDRGDV
jgi:hypothetical protein